MEPAPETRTLPRETLDALDALERLVRRHHAVSEAEAQVALKALVPEGGPTTLEEAFEIARAARPPPRPREETDSRPMRRGRGPRSDAPPAEGAAETPADAPAPEAPAAEAPAEAPAEAKPDEPPKSE